MPEYEVTWIIDIEAPTPREAARKAREIQLDPRSIATCFQVRVFTDTKNCEVSPDWIDVDLMEEEEEEVEA